MRKLIVSVNSVAVMREDRKEKAPDPVMAAAGAELAGVDGIAIHLRLDKRHIRERDLYILRETVKTKLDLYIAPVAEMAERALEVKPAEVTLVAERSGELTTERGLDLHEMSGEIAHISEQLKAAGCNVFAVVEPEPDSAKHAAKIGLDGIELYAHHYSDAQESSSVKKELERAVKTYDAARKNDLIVRIGGGLNYANIVPLLNDTGIQEYVVGHAIAARAITTGFEKATRDMVEIVKYF